MSKKTATVYWTHDALVSDMRHYFAVGGHCVFAEPKLGSAYLSGGKVPIPDIYTFRKSYTKTDIHAIEIKAHRSDLQADIRNQKWEKYYPFSDRISFALAPGIEWKDLLDGQPVGIMVRGPSEWRVLRAAPRHGQRQPIPEEVFMSLFFSHLEYERKEVARLRRLEAEKEMLLSEEIKNLYRLRNRALADKLAQIKNIELQAQRDTESIKADAWREIRTALGIDNYFSSSHALADTIRDLFLPAIQSAVERQIEKLVAAKREEKDA